MTAWPFGIVGIILTAALSGWIVVRGLLTGAINARGVTYSRKEMPVIFWAIITTFGGLLAYSLWVGVPFVLISLGAQ